MQPITPPVPVERYIKVTKSWEPYALSFLLWITMIASDTTLVNASDNAAVARTIATTNGSSYSKQ